MTALGRAGQSSKAVALLETMTKHGLEPDVITYTMAINAFAKNGQWREALQMLNQMRQGGGSNPTSSATSSATSNAMTRAIPGSILDSNLSSPAESAALAEFESGSGSGSGPGSDLVAAGPVGVEPNVFTMNALIRALGNGGEWVRALEMLLKTMPDEGLTPNTVSFNTALSACAQAGQWEKALMLMTEMRERKLLPGEGLHTPPRTYNHDHTSNFLPTLVRPAFALATSTHLPPPSLPQDVITYNTCISAMNKGEPPQWDYAVKLLHEMGTVEPPISPNVVTYGSAMSACAKAGKWEKALELMDEMQAAKPPIVPNTVCYSTIISAFATAGEVCWARHVGSPSPPPLTHAHVRARAYHKPYIPHPTSHAPLTTHHSPLTTRRSPRPRTHSLTHPSGGAR